MLDLLVYLSYIHIVPTERAIIIDSDIMETANKAFKTAQV